MTKLNTTWPLYSMIPDGERQRCQMQGKGCVHWAIVIYIPTQTPLCECCKVTNDHILWEKSLK